MDHLGIPDWYEPHVQAWSKRALPSTTLWFWNSEIGWVTAHPLLERYGWRYVSTNIWNKGVGHIAGNVNTAKIRRFPVVSEVCVQYVRDVTVNGQSLKSWLRSEWQRTGLSQASANEACGVKSAATRKYFDQGHQWYFPPPDAFDALARYANEHGRLDGLPYYSEDGVRPLTGAEWAEKRSVFNCPFGYTNVWDRPALHGPERVTTDSGKVSHRNQKPLDLMSLIIEASTETGDVVWEPFGGLFSASLAARNSGRRAFACELDPETYQCGADRFSETEVLNRIFHHG